MRKTWVLLQNLQAYSYTVVALIVIILRRRRLSVEERHATGIGVLLWCFLGVVVHADSHRCDVGRPAQPPVRRLKGLDTQRRRELGSTDRAWSPLSKEVLMRIRKLVLWALLVGIFAFTLGVGAWTLFVATSTPVAAAPCQCPKIYAPVTCDNGKTYPNQCVADCRHADNCVPSGGV